MENRSNTPDFILAEYMLACLRAFEKASNDRQQWYGVDLQPGMSRPTPAPADGLDAEEKCMCPSDGVWGLCPIHGTRRR